MAETKYCSNCGTQINEEAYECPNCGNIQPKSPGTKYCSNCGNQIDKRAEICPDCGVRQPGAPKYQQVYQEKNPVVAAVLSLLVVGLGQVYNGEVGKGLLFFIVAIIIGLTLFIYIGFILVPLFWLFAAYDAYTTAEKINRGEQLNNIF